MLLPGRTVVDNVRWNITNESQGLCTPTNSPNGQYSSLLDCMEYARPQNRQLRWNVVNSSGVGPNGSTVGICRPSLDAYALFSDAKECASSALAQYSAYPDPSRPRGWICINPVLGECVETENIGVPFTYRVYATHEQCKSAPENNIDSSVMMNGLPPLKRHNPKWYIDADRGRCYPSTLDSAPFNNEMQCKTALFQCGYNGQPTLQFSNPIQAPDAHWLETGPYTGFYTDQGRNVTPYMQQPQVGLHPISKPTIVGTNQLVPGLASAGYSLLG